MGKNRYGKDFKKKHASKTKNNTKSDPIKGGKLKASHILVEKFSKAQEIYEGLRKGANFENIAKQFSICSSKKRGGNLGEFTKGDMVSEFWNACSRLKIGEISQPIKSRFGYHIIKRTG